MRLVRAIIAGAYQLKFSMQSIRPPQAKDYVFLVTLSAIWASTFICIEIALQGFTPFAIAAWRIFIGFIALLPFVIIHWRKLPQGWRVWGLIALVGMLYNAIPFTLVSWGQQFIPSSTTAIVMACGPFIALVLSHLLTPDDKFTLGKMIGVVLGFSGVSLLIGFEAIEGSAQAVVGQIAMVAAVVCYILSALLIRRITGLSPLLISAAVLGTTSIYMIPVMFLAGEQIPETVNLIPLIGLVVLGLIPTAAEYILRIQIVQQVGTTFLSQAGYMMPLFGLFWSWLFLNQIPGQVSWIALVLVLTGLAVSRGRISWFVQKSHRRFLLK